MSREIYPLEPLFGRILSPFQEFLRRTTAGGIVLIASTIVALVIASSAGSAPFTHFWQYPLSVSLGELLKVELSLRQWVNDALMALFFLVVGLELKREILVGELSSLKDAALPVIAAAGGMLIPALFYAAFNAGAPGAAGWGVAMATDIAFAIGILVVLAWRIPRNLIVFLTALAVADDLGAVLVIALFYTEDLQLQWLTVAAALFVVSLLLNRAGVRHGLPYAITGVLLWIAVHESGIHATLAGVLVALTIPARPRHTPAVFDERIAELQSAFRADRRDEDTPDDPLSNPRMARIAEAMEHSAAAVQSPLQRFEHVLTPWVTFVVIPVFALSNAGIDLRTVAWQESASSAVTVGVFVGLVFGKFLGISLFSWGAVRLRLARLPTGVRWGHLLGAAWLGGIGFTMSLFIAQLAFSSPEMIEQAKLGIVLGSATSATIGLAWLLVVAARGEPTA